MTGIASSYVRMLVKVSHFNQLRTEKDQLTNQYSQLEQVARERDIQVASLGSLAGEVSSLYGLKSDSILTARTSDNLRDAQDSLLDRPVICPAEYRAQRRGLQRHFARPYPQRDHR